MMFLRTNETALLERIKTTGLDVNGEHRKKIERLLVRMAPPPSQSTSKQQFEHLEQCLGHNLFVTSIKRQTSVFEGDTATSMDRICFGASENGI
jgi:hypothetical protein